MKIFIAGKPGCGKSTLILELIDILKNKCEINNHKIAGIITPEIKQEKGKSREGFNIIDLATGKKAVLASIDIKSKYKISKYGVNIEGINNIVEEFGKSFNSAAIVVIDEAAPMEFISDKFKEVFNKILKSDKKCIIAIHRSLVNKYEGSGKTFWLTRGNFNEIKEKIIKELL